MTLRPDSARPVQPYEVLVHGACVALDGFGALLRGPSGSGKSDLALRFTGLGPQYMLVADDQVLIDARTEVAQARPHPALAGLIEVRGIGVVRQPFLAPADLRLIVDLSAAEEIPRVPPDPPPTIQMGAAQVPMLHLAPFEAAAEIKLALAIEWAIGLAGMKTIVKDSGAVR